MAAFVLRRSEFRRISNLKAKHTMNTSTARYQMVNQQIRTWDVTDEGILDLLARLPRDDFAPAAYRHLAYADCAVPLGHGELMMVPSVEGRLLQALALDAQDVVLEVGTGSGYLSACLAALASRVVTVDIHDDFVSAARERFARHAIDNVAASVMDACRELPDGRFDAIAVTGSLATLDQRYIDALRPGGRLFIVTGEHPVMEAQLVVRGNDDDWRATSLFETSLRRLQNAPEPSGFSF